MSLRPREDDFGFARSSDALLPPTAISACQCVLVPYILFPFDLECQTLDRDERFFLTSFRSETGVDLLRWEVLPDLLSHLGLIRMFAKSNTCHGCTVFVDTNHPAGPLTIL